MGAASQPQHALEISLPGDCFLGSVLSVHSVPRVYVYVSTRACVCTCVCAYACMLRLSPLEPLVLGQAYLLRWHTGP